MDKTSQKVTKDPKRKEEDKKSYKTYMKRLKKNILQDIQISTPSSNSTPSMDNCIPFTPSSTNNFTTRSSDTYIYGVGIVAFLSIGVFVFLEYNTSQTANKKQANEEQQQPFKPPKRRSML